MDRVGSIHEVDSWSVIHLSSGHSGGAGIAARRLNSALNKAGVRSTFLALKNSDFRPLQNEISLRRGFFNLARGKLYTVLQNRISSEVLFTIFSSNSFSTKTIRKLANPKNTILHFHNWFNLVNQNQIIRLSKLGYPIVITLHDERFFTGGCHYSLECNQFTLDCVSCPKLPKIYSRVPERNLKTGVKIESIRDFVAIAPSKWILSQARRSRILANQRVIHIPNALDSLPLSDGFRDSRQSTDKLFVGIASNNPSAYIKGGDLLDGLQEIISRNESLIELLFLNSEFSQEDSESNFWKRIDLLLVPSRADNSPNVIHEAKIRGIPIVASNVGGIPELMQASFDTIIPIASLTAEYLHDVLIAWKPPKNAERIFMLNNFQKFVKTSIPMHIQVYEDLLSTKLESSL